MRKRPTNALPMNMASFGAKLRYYRLQAGLYQEELGEVLGVYKGIIRKWENQEHEPNALNQAKFWAWVKKSNLVLRKGETEKISPFRRRGMTMKLNSILTSHKIGKIKSTTAVKKIYEIMRNH